MKNINTNFGSVHVLLVQVQRLLNINKKVYTLGSAFIMVISISHTVVSRKNKTAKSQRTTKRKAYSQGSVLNSQQLPYTCIISLINGEDVYLRKWERSVSL